MKNNEISSGHIIEVNINDTKGIWQPETFINITAKKFDLSKMIKDNHFRIRINNKDYWMPFIEKI